jgi:hypothetical protein
VLFGLRVSPNLWQQEASAVLTKFSLVAFPEGLCVLTAYGIIVVFYVDDILIASNPSVREKAR